MKFPTATLPLLAGFFATTLLPAQRAATVEDPAEVLKNAPKATQSITAEDLKKHAGTLASDEFEGRLTGTPGQIKAAEYFKTHFEQLKLKPLGDKKGGKTTYYQEYPLELDGFVDDKTGLFDSAGKRVTSFGAWFVRWRQPAKIDIKGRLVFGGTGESLEDLDMGGAIAVLYFDARDQDGMNVQRAMGEGFRLIAKVKGLARNARTAGAKACVLISPKLPVAFLSSANMMTSYPGKPLVTNPGQRGGMQFGGGAPAIPTVVLGGEDAEKVLEAIGLSKEQAYSDEQLAVGQKSKGAYRLTAVRKEEKIGAINVCAYLPGSDSRLKSEAIVFSCHMDHLGRTADGGCFNGADDNGSGSATVLEIAEAFANLDDSERPKRTVIFLAVSGEELGLWGSAHYAEHPTWPLGKIVANINMDMLGRSTDRVPSDTVALTPTYRNKDYSTLARDAALLGQAFDLKMSNGDRFYQRSDHWNFAKHGIPVVFFCDDEHADYHMPSDTPDKLEYDKMAKIGQLAFLIGYRAANADGRPETIGRQKDWLE